MGKSSFTLARPTHFSLLPNRNDPASIASLAGFYLRHVSLKMETAGDFVPPFSHRPLPDYHIRVVHILPSEQRSAPIECRIAVHSNQLERPEYEALSYAWGDPQDGEKTILVDGQPFAIRLNLWLFLEQLRRDRSVRVVWVDAICIDQRNTEERNHHVKRMGDIYRNACRTLIWLGPSDQDSDMLFEAISMIYETASPHREYYEKVKSLSEFDLRTSMPEFEELWKLIEEHKRKSLSSEDEDAQLGAWYRKALSNHFSDSTTFMRLRYHSFDRMETPNSQSRKTYDLFIARNELAMPTSADSVAVDRLSHKRENRISETMGHYYAGLLRKYYTLSFGLLMVEEQEEKEVLTRQDWLNNHPLVLKALSDLSTRPYWKRLWIVQEIILSRNIELFCGNKVALWNRLIDMLRACESSQHENRRTIAASNASALYREWEKRHKETTEVHAESLVGLTALKAFLDAFETSLCADVRDKVYGFLGLVETPLEPDYSKSPLELFAQLMELFKTGLDQEDSGRHEHPMSDLLHFGRLLQRSLRLDITGPEKGARDDAYPSIVQTPGEIFGKVLVTASNAAGVEEIADALFDNWMTLRTPPALPDRQKAFARSSLLHCIHNLSKTLARHSDESFSSVQHRLFSSTLTQPGKILAIKYSPHGHEPTPIRCKSPSGFTRRLCWFVYSLGRVGVSDVDVQEGDLICNCSGISPTHAVVLRESPCGLQIVGRVMVSPVPFTNASSFGIQGQQDEAAVEDSKLKISFDALSLLAFALLPFP